MKPKFDGYAAQYDAWFMENENVFQSEFRLFEKALGDISGKRVLSVGCGSGLFESMIDCKNIEGVEPSRDVGAIAQKRGINVIAFGAIEEVELEENACDIIYLNGNSSYMEDLTRAFDVAKRRSSRTASSFRWMCPRRARSASCTFSPRPLARSTIRPCAVSCPNCRIRSNCAARACGTRPRKRSTRSNRSASTILTSIRRF